MMRPNGVKEIKAQNVTIATTVTHSTMMRNLVVRIGPYSKKPLSTFGVENGTAAPPKNRRNSVSINRASAKVRIRPSKGSLPYSRRISTFSTSMPSKPVPMGASKAAPQPN